MLLIETSSSPTSTRERLSNLKYNEALNKVAAKQKLNTAKEAEEKETLWNSN